MEINLKDIQKKLGKKAREYANDKEKTARLINDASDKAEHLDKSSPMEVLYERLQLLFGIIKDWSNGTYKEVPKGSIVIIIIGLIYFLAPVDLIPDFLPGGFVDDALVLALVFKQVGSDLEKYKIWKQNR